MLPPGYPAQCQPQTHLEHSLKLPFLSTQVFVRGIAGPDPCHHAGKREVHVRRCFPKRTESCLGIRHQGSGNGLWMGDRSIHYLGERNHHLEQQDRLYVGQLLLSDPTTECSECSLSLAHEHSGTIIGRDGRKSSQEPVRFQDCPSASAFSCLASYNVI